MPKKEIVYVRKENFKEALKRYDAALVPCEYGIEYVSGNERFVIRERDDAKE